MCTLLDMDACTDTHAHGGGNPACPDLHRTFCACGGTDADCRNDR